MAFLIDSVTVIKDGRYDFPDNGISYLLHFFNLDYEVPKCTIAGSGEYPLSGGAQMYTNNTVLRTYGESLFFDTVPLDMLKADAQTPQILVYVDGMEALCLDLNCDYTYTVPDMTITGQDLNQTADADNNTLTIYGTNLPIDATDFIWVGPIGCARNSTFD